MRHGRAKQARKTLLFWKLQYSIAGNPYHVLLDGTFLLQVVKMKVPLQERLSKLLQHSTVILYVCRSSLNELKSLSENTTSLSNSQREQFRAAYQYGLDECDVIVEPKDIPTKKNDDSTNSDFGLAGNDIWSLVKNHNNHSYVVASQQEDLLDQLRRNACTPIIRLSRGVLLLEQPSKFAQQQANRKEYKKWRSSNNKKEQELIQTVKWEQEKQQSTTTTQHVRVKPKAKGPNPLSCKTSSKRSTVGDESTDKPKRKRRRKQNNTKQAAEMEAS